MKGQVRTWRDKGKRVTEKQRREVEQGDEEPLGEERKVKTVKTRQRQGTLSTTNKALSSMLLTHHLNYLAGNCLCYTEVYCLL